MTRGTRRLTLWLALLAALTTGTTAGAATVPSPAPSGTATASSGTAAAPAGAVAAAGSDSDGGGDPGALAQQQRGIAAGLAAADNAIEGETAASATARAALDSASAQLPSANATLARADATLAKATAAVAAAKKAIAAATRSLTTAKAAQAGTEAQMARQHAALGAAVRSSVEGGPTGLARAVLTATDPDSLVDNQEALSRLGNDTADTLAALEVSRKAEAAEILQAGRAQAQVVAEQTIAVQAQATAAAAARASAADSSRVQRLVAMKASAYKGVQSQLATDENNYAELDRESNQVAALIAAAERAAQVKAAAAAEAAKAAAAAAAATKPTTRAPVAVAATPGPSGLLWPTPGPVTSSFGYRVDPVTHQRALHAGIDIGAPEGQAIMAAQAGTVIFAGQEQGYGNYTCIDHGGGFATCYAHQSSILVTVGQVVARGQEIGLVGHTGYATGPHLHFETRVNGQPVDPMTYF